MKGELFLLTEGCNPPLLQFSKTKNVKRGEVEGERERKAMKEEIGDMHVWQEVPLSRRTFLPVVGQHEKKNVCVSKCQNVCVCKQK